MVLGESVANKENVCLLCVAEASGWGGNEEKKHREVTGAYFSDGGELLTNHRSYLVPQKGVLHVASLAWCLKGNFAEDPRCAFILLLQLSSGWSLLGEDAAFLQLACCCLLYQGRGFCSTKNTPSLP